jgi:hypothetical protein
MNSKNLAVQTSLRRTLQNEPSSNKFEELIATLLSQLLGLNMFVASSGRQYGGDIGNAKQQGRNLRIECKRYLDTTALNTQSLIGGISSALRNDSELEAWVLVTTREVSEQCADELTAHGRSIGVPIIILDFKPSRIGALAALCTLAPEVVGELVSQEAGELAKQLQSSAADTLQTLRRDLAFWQLGFETLRALSTIKLEQLWQNPATSKRLFGQDVAGGDESKKIRRSDVYAGLEAWWTDLAMTGSPVTVVGKDGVGKTWATLDWLVEQRAKLGIVLVIPSAAATTMPGLTETSFRGFIADRLLELTQCHDSAYWLQRLARILQRPTKSAPILTIFFDGLNQTPTVNWLQLHHLLQENPFFGRIQLISTTRNHHFDQDLSKLQALVKSAALVEVNAYDSNPNGELDQMLALNKLSRTDLHQDLIVHASIPRLFKLVIRYRESLVDAGALTVHRLLWEYGRDSLGEKAGSGFSHDEWAIWLQRLAGEMRSSISSEFTIDKISNLAARPDLSSHQVYARMSEIMDGHLIKDGEFGSVNLDPTLVAHALGLALIAHLQAIKKPTFRLIESELSNWLDPVSGLLEQSEVLRAAVSILIACKSNPASHIASALICAWLQTQNLPETHYQEMKGLAANVPDALLDAIEHSNSPPHAAARLYAVNALRTIDRENSQIFQIIFKRLQDWSKVVSRGKQRSEYCDFEMEDSRSSRMIETIGVDTSGPVYVLDHNLQLVDHDDEVMARYIPLLLENYALAPTISLFEAAAISKVIRDRSDCWDGLKWLCLLNQRDSNETLQGLRASAKVVQAKAVTPKIKQELPMQVAALMLKMTSEHRDEKAAIALLRRPETKDCQLAETELSLYGSIQRTRDFWKDPNFTPSRELVMKIVEAGKRLTVAYTERRKKPRPEELNFEEFEPVLARCAPDLIPAIFQRKMQNFLITQPDSRHWRAVRAAEHMILADQNAAKVAGDLRKMANTNQTQPYNGIANNQLLFLELYDQPGIDQAATLVNANLDGISINILLMLRPITQTEAESLVDQFGIGSVAQKRAILALLAHNRFDLSENLWTWLIDIASGTDTDLQGLAYFALAQLDAKRFADELNDRNWQWELAAPYWVNHYGTSVLIAATLDRPFEQVMNRMAPWRILEAVRIRGAKPDEIKLAVTIVGSIIAAKNFDVPDLGSTLSVDRMTPFPNSDGCSTLHSAIDNYYNRNPLSGYQRFFAQQDSRSEANRYAIEAASTRINDAWKAGASLYMHHVDIADVRMIVTNAPNSVGDWLPGESEQHENFVRRIELQEELYLALCEVLLEIDDLRGAELWLCLRKVLKTRFVGVANVDELVHIPFRVGDSAAAAGIRTAMVALDRCNTDGDLLNIAIAATIHGKADWLSNLINEDEMSPHLWQRKRGIVLKGFTSNNALPVGNARVEKEVLTSHDDLCENAARFQFREACAHHWWVEYLNSSTAATAFAAWAMFLRSVDRRAWVWLDDELRKVSDSVGLSERDSGLLKLKILHCQVNLSNLKQAMEKNEGDVDQKFLNRKIDSRIWPWRKDIF